MATGWGPAVVDRKLRVELRALRQKAEITQRNVARAMDWSVSKLMRIESGEVSITTNDLKVLLSFYDVRDYALVEKYVEMAKAIKRDGPWAAFSDVHSQTFLTYLEFEAAAQRIRKFHTLHIPGLMQTEEYCKKVQEGGWSYSRADTERRWKARSLRQQLHYKKKKPSMSFILDEAAVRREVGGREVMSKQIERLIEWSETPHVTLQIVPFDSGAYDGMKGSFIVLDFEDPALDSMLYLEPPLGEMHLVEAADVVHPYVTRFSNLEKKAETPEDTRELLKEVMSELDNEKSK